MKPSRKELISALTDLADALGILSGGADKLLGYGFTQKRSNEIQETAKAAYDEETNK